MPPLPPLSEVLAVETAGREAGAELACTLTVLADAGRQIAGLLADGALAGHHGDIGVENSQGETQKKLDVLANSCLLAHLQRAPVAACVSEELPEAVPVRRAAPLLVAFDPLDGSSNIDTNLSVGTIFSVLPAPADGAVDDAAFLRPGAQQLAAGYVLYGPSTVLVLTLGNGTMGFTLDRGTRVFRLTQPRIEIAPRTREFAINMSNRRHWDRPMRRYIDECVAGADGVRGADFNMRWVASFVAEVHRILTRGGIYLYPRDARPGYAAGRLRLLYEVNPLGLVVEQAGGRASTGDGPALAAAPRSIHARAPVILGAREEVERVEAYLVDADEPATDSPLFGMRGLFRP